MGDHEDEAALGSMQGAVAMRALLGAGLAGPRIRQC